MKLFKKILLVAALLLPGCVLAQGTVDMSQNEIIRGTAGEMVIFKALPNMTEIYFSRNGKFLMGRDGTDNSFGFIYEIATEKIEMLNSSVVEVIDWDNYVTTTYAKIDGEEYDRFADVAMSNPYLVEEASADLLTLRASMFFGNATDYGNFFIDTKTGTIIDTLRKLDPTFAGGMNMGWHMSNDASIVVGRASKTNATLNYAPAFWDRNQDAVYYVGHEFINGTGFKVFAAGELWDLNGSGTLMCGEINDQACYVEYNKNTADFKVSMIDISPGYGASQLFRMNDSGVMLGTEQTDPVDLNSRRPFIYFWKDGRKYIQSEYLQYLYGIDAERDMPLFTPTGISNDGRYMIGYSSIDATWYTYLIKLNEHQAYAPVRNVRVENKPRRSSNVEVSWQAPLEGEYTLTGYNIFRDGQSVGTVPATQLTYTDVVPENDKYKYCVKAVYEGDHLSEAFDTTSILVLDPSSCLPVLEIFKNVTYNRTVSLSWGLPSDKEASNVINRPKGHTPKYIPQEGLDFVSVFQPATLSMSGGIRIGDYIYTGSYATGHIYVYDEFGNIAKDISVDGLGTIYDMTYHNGSFYVTTASERVLKLDLSATDPFKIGLSDHITTRFDKAISVTYVENDNPDINNGEDYILVGDYYNIAAYPHDAVNANSEFELPVKFNTEGMVVSGLEYYKGRLYMVDQKATNGCDLVAYDMTDGKKLFTTDLSAHPTVQDAAFTGMLYGGALTHTQLSDGTVVLECLLQCTNSYNVIVDMELESSSEVLGYVVYRDGKRVSDTLRARHFTENIDTAGTYTYHIEYLSTRGCSSSSAKYDAKCEVDIFEKGDCLAPKGMMVYESNKKAVLSWSEDCLGEDGFVGFNLYRNGEQIEEPNFYKLSYIDSDVEIGTEYEYRLEAFYESSCVADTTVKIKLNGLGAAREPSVFTVTGTPKDDNTIDAKATWGLPYFEEPMAYGYCSFPVGRDNITGTSQAFFIIGWDEKDMDKFDDDLYLVGVEFAVGAESKSLRAVNTLVYVDDVLRYNKPYNERFGKADWVQVYFDEVFPMKQKEEIAVGYSVSYDVDELAATGETVVAYDMGPGTHGKSDLFSVDGRSYISFYKQFGIDVNFCINALVVRLRDLEAAASAADPQEYIMSKVMSTNVKGQLMGQGLTFDGPKTSSAGIKLIGYNIYRNGDKLNENLLTEYSYEENVARGEYDYEVGAVYEGEGAEEKKAFFFIDFTTLDMEDLQQAYGVSVYPNPVSDRLNIQGEYVSFSLVDMNGRVCMRDVRNAESVSLAGLSDGVYFMLITLPNGDKRSVKVIKR